MACTGGEKGRHLWSRLVQKKTAESKSFYELSWKVKVTIKKNKKEAMMQVVEGTINNCVRRHQVFSEKVRYRRWKVQGVTHIRYQVSQEV